MPNGIDSIVAALGGGGDRFFESPQTAFERTQEVGTAQRRQQQREQLDLITQLLEAQTSQQIRAKQATDPEARIVQLLSERQIAPATGLVQRPGAERELRTFAPSADIIGQLTNLIGLQTAKATKATAPADNLSEILGEFRKREEAITPLVAELNQPGLGTERKDELTRLLVAQRDALMQEVTALKNLGAPWDKIADDLSGRLATMFRTAGVPFRITPKAGEVPPPAPSPTAAPTEKPKARKPEEQQLSEGLARLIADLLGIGAAPGAEFVTP